MKISHARNVRGARIGHQDYNRSTVMSIPLSVRELQRAKAIQLIEDQLEIEAQHGPVKVLWKDGKPV